MIAKVYTSLLMVLLLTLLPGVASSQFDPGEMPVWIVEILNIEGTRLGTVLVAGTSNRGYDAGHEYWRFGEQALQEIAGFTSLEFAVLASGDWDAPDVVEALEWLPPNRPVAWSHPAEVEWTESAQTPPPEASEGTHFGNPTLGGLTIQYTESGPASLTWFKATAGAFMQLEDGALFEREEEAPTEGSWWHGAIELAG